MTCAELLVRVADTALAGQSPDGSMPAGHNGPYRHPETPVRSSSHWMHTFLKAYALTGERRFEDAAHRIARWLLRPELRPGGYTFHYRTAAGKSYCSGLVGQAWTLEALTLAWKHFNSAEHLALALEIYRSHDFDPSAGLWRIREIDGSSLGFDPTLNHQLWFAAGATGLLDANVAEVHQTLDIFLQRVPDNMLLFPNGLIYQPIPHLQSRRWRVGLIANRVIGSSHFPRMSLRYRPLAKSFPQYMKCVGYQSFCAYALGTLRLRMPNHACWHSPMAGHVARYLLSPEYAALIAVERKYGFPYNAPGFAVAFAVSALLDLSDMETSRLASSWMTAQLRDTFSLASGRFDRATPDATTLTARIYEMSRLSNEVLRSAELENGASPAPSRHRASGTPSAPAKK
jgi:hypothetical protein